MPERQVFFTIEWSRRIPRSLKWHSLSRSNIVQKIGMIQRQEVSQLFVTNRPADSFLAICSISTEIVNAWGGYGIFDLWPVSVVFSPWNRLYLHIFWFPQLSEDKNEISPIRAPPYLWMSLYCELRWSLLGIDDEICHPNSSAVELIHIDKPLRALALGKSSGGGGWRWII